MLSRSQLIVLLAVTLLLHETAVESNEGKEGGFAPAPVGSHHVVKVPGESEVEEAISEEDDHADEVGVAVVVITSKGEDFLGVLSEDRKIVGVYPLDPLPVLEGEVVA